MKINIGIDIADTIIDVWPNLIKKAEDFNTNHSNHPKSQEKYLYLPEDIFNWNQEETKMFWDLYREELAFDSIIKPDVKETIDYLKSISCKIYFITVKTPSDYIDLEQKIIKLLKNNDIFYDEIYTQVSNKGKFCKEKDISYLIDDSYNNCLSAINNGKIGLLITNPYNEDRIMPDNMYRINRFCEVKKYIKKYS